MASRALSMGLLWLSACAAPVGETRVAAGVDHTCELRGGMLRCWGADDFGQLGGDALGRLRGARSVGAGGNTTCVIDALGTVLCAGQNHHGQLGDGTLEARADMSPVAGLEPALEVAVGFAHACARTAAGVICCWGWGASGQLTPGGDTDSSSPICRETNARRVVAGFDTTCAIDDRDRATCWGGVDAPPADGVRDVAIGADHVCLLRDAELRCHGSQPGGGRASIDGVLSFPLGGRVAAGALDHLCVTDGAGTLHCFGKNERGQLGDGTFGRRDAPREVRGLPAPVTSVAVGFSHTCAAVGGRTWCWGWNDQGQLGDATGIHSLDPVLVANP